MVVSRMPNSKKYQEALETELKQAGLNPDKVFYASALKCRTFEQDASKTDLKTCRQYLEAEIAIVKPRWILVMGNEALFAATGHSGITKYRGQLIEKHGATVMGTMSQAAVTRQPGQMASWRADLRFFAGKVSGRAQEIELPKIAVIDTNDKLRKLYKLLGTADVISYDIETRGDIYTPDGVIVSIAFTFIHGERMTVAALPLCHPESPWRRVWVEILRRLNKRWHARRQIAHNGKFDAKWLRWYGVENAKVTFDTMLAAHLLDENRQKGLKPLARILFGAEPWAISTKDLWATPIREVLKYNAIDTFWTYHIYRVLRRQLMNRPRLAKIFQHIIMPANEEYIESERHGIYLDMEKLASATHIAFQMRDEIDAKLMEWVPDSENPGSSLHAALTSPWPTKGKRAKPVEVNFNASNFARWWLFEHLGLPVLRTGKDKDDGSPGAPSMAEDVMLQLRDDTHHPVIDLLLERSKWQKYCSSYVTAYAELADENHRLHTTFKLAGTRTGRTSSGKEEEEKITARRKKERGLNLQQVPRDSFIRGLFGAPPGYTFVEADFSQVELREIAFVSRDPTMLGIYQRGEDIHRATAAWVLGVPESKIGKDDRKAAKAVNFGFAYGMGAPKFVSTAYEKYGLVVTVDQARAIRKQFFERFAGLPAWHARQRRLVNKHGYVTSPIGRVRHLPDIYSPDEGVAAEAERQAINSPIQSFGSDMLLISMILISRRAKKLGLDIKIVGTVHDACNFEVKNEHLGPALRLIKECMEDRLVLTLAKVFDLHVDVPIKADCKLGQHWGEAKEVPEDAFQSTETLQMWLWENGTREEP